MLGATEINSSFSELPEGVRLFELCPHQDERGSFIELFRQAWCPVFDPLQINFVQSNANVLRGVHVHRQHSDYLVFLSGEVSLGLFDLRQNTRTSELSVVLDLKVEQLKGIFIPPGVAHGFLFHTDAQHVYAVDTYFDGSDEFGCRFDDSDLNLNWPIKNPKISERDQRLGSLKDLKALVATW